MPDSDSNKKADSKGVPGSVPDNHNNAARSAKVANAQFEACRAKLGDGGTTPEAAAPSVKL